MYWAPSYKIYSLERSNARDLCNREHSQQTSPHIIIFLLFMQHECSLEVKYGNMVTNGQYVVSEPKIIHMVSIIW